jgi:hypothetical protein
MLRNTRSIRSLGLLAAAGLIPAHHAVGQAGPDPLWITQFGTTESDIARAAASDEAGGVYIVGDTEGSLAAPNMGARDVFIARHDSTGNQVWARQIGSVASGSSLTEFGAAAMPDGAGGVIATGWTQGHLAGPGSWLGSNDVYVVRYDANGNQLWLQQWGTNGSDVARGLTSDSAGGFFITGNTNRDLVAGSGPSLGGNDIFLARYDGNGLRHWIVQIGTALDDIGRAVIGDGSGGVYMTGDTTGTLVTSAGGRDAFLARYDANGAQLWIRQIGTSADDFGYALAQDSAGGVFITGITRGDLAGPNQGDYDVYLARYDSAGNQLWVRQFGTPVWDEAFAIVADGAGGVFISGTTLGDLAATSAGGRDIFLARYDGAGSRTWIKQLGSAGDENARGLTSDGAGGVFVTGETFGDLGGSNLGSADVYLARFPGDAPCYANCDNSTTAPILNVEDFTCFINNFAAASLLTHQEQLNHYANCDNSTTAPVLNVEDFTCFINEFAAGCP